MRILLIISILNTILWSNNSCNLDTSSIIKKLENKYDKEIRGKNFKPQYNPTLSMVCQKSFGAKGTILVLPYLKKDVTEPNSDYYDLSLIIALFDTKTKKIQQSYFHENIAHSEDTWFIENINVIQNTHPFSVGLEIVRKGASSVFIQWDKSLFLYEKKGKTLTPILLDFIYKSLEADYEIDYKEGKEESFEIKPRKSIMAHPPLLFSHKYKYFNNEESWEVKLDPITLVFKDGKYQRKSADNGVLFDLKEIESNVKKGLKYKIKVLKAMLYEVPISKKNLNNYNNIAYYLQKVGHNKEAVVLLEKIVNSFPTRMVAHYNLADAYWALGQKDKAHTHYGSYIKQMKKVGKEKKIPQIVRERYKTSSNSFEKGFVAVHKKVQSISPLLLENKGAEAIAIVPWLQKKLFYVDDANDGKIMKVIAYEKNGKMAFVYFLMSTVKNEVGLLKLFGIDQEKNRPFLIGEVPTSFIEEDIDSKYFPPMIQDEFLIKGQTVYFFHFNNEKGDDYYRYRYDFGDKKIKPFRFTIDKKRESYAYKAYAHDEKMFAESSNGELVIGVDGDTHVEFVTQEMDGGFVIGSETWSEDDKILYFDNYGELLACIWRYNLETKELSKIVPEHEAEHPFAFSYKGKEYVVYIEGQDIKVATEGEI